MSYKKRVIRISTHVMSSQLDPTLGTATQADAACMKEGAKIKSGGGMVDAATMWVGLI